ncbi:MAG: glucose-6-phosphate isomerase [Bacteroidales bacterium]|jgi:glucose-6-phosphate isomerase|nr:glucose-6-phosphate isomerase [Bacteroidales bacterium]
MENVLTLNLKNAEAFISLEETIAFAGQSVRHLETLNAGTGAGSDFLGWLTLPSDIQVQIDKIEKAAARLRSITDTTVVIGIGGSYLGARAINEALAHSFSPYLKQKQAHEILFAGQNICEDYFSELIEILDERNYSIIVISKSGTTTEPAIAFRILEQHLEKKVGKKETEQRIIAITDEQKGALRSLADANKYETFVIPDNVGGRYSVLSPVGMLPIAVSGLNIRALAEGARDMELITRKNKDITTNPALLYAAARNLLLKGGRLVEIMVGFTPKLYFFAEWWKQLYGESEGKDGRGIFPASVNFTTDLHSLGQYIQEGQRILFETVISVKNPARTVTVPASQDDSDQLNYLAGRRLSEVNHNAEDGTILAHNDGNVPVIKIEIPAIDEYYLGQMIYFLEISCGISGYMLDINPFDQPGVEAYKKNMFALLNKPGYEEVGRELRKRL